MENFVVYVDAERELSRRRFVANLRRMFPETKLKLVKNDNEKTMYEFFNNRCYVGLKLDYEDPNTAKIWAMISKYNAEMVRKYPTLKMLA